MEVLVIIIWVVVGIILGIGSFIMWVLHQDDKIDREIDKAESEKQHQPITHVHAFNPGSFNPDNIDKYSKDYK